MFTPVSSACHKHSVDSQKGIGAVIREESMSRPWKFPSWKARRNKGAKPFRRVFRRSENARFDLARAL